MKSSRAWHLDEMAVRVGGKQHWLWRAVDEHGVTLEVLLQERRETEAAERFFRRLLADTGGQPPERIATGKLGSYAAARQRVPGFRGVEPQHVRSALRCNNRVKQDHQPTRIRERRMGRFRCPTSAQRLLSAFARISNLFRPRRQLLSASEYRSILRDRFTTWREAAALAAA